MKTLIFSDTHLTDEFEPEKYDFLKKIISGADSVVINGDFWDGFKTTFDAFMASSWQKLFPLLKSRKTFYIYGNHDDPSKSDERVSFFSDHQGDRYEFIHGKNTFYIWHGHISDFLFGGTEPKWYLKIITMMYDLVEKYGLELFGKRSRRFFIDKRLSDYLLRRYQSNLPEDTYLICGHSHWSSFNEQKRYVNLGDIQNGYASYAVVTDGNVELIQTQYA
ncbi:metallophosphoesterase family protein [candidate division WWE3 bacterium]|uniref:Metallophosphoesterase family protein n=1 Tax=candidate division WWE3 bacterium TaxID=2053526 RepID=A0A955LGF8_UNCKA|nr:metallophosphoesterase family protein [candidate division WWE3 bacterium]